MYRRPKFLEILLEIRRQMALEADYDVDLFTEIARSGTRHPPAAGRNPDPDRTRAEHDDAMIAELTRSRDA